MPPATPPIQRSSLRTSPERRTDAKNALSPGGAGGGGVAGEGYDEGAGPGSEGRGSAGSGVCVSMGRSWPGALPAGIGGSP
ncbi:hypothetical protein CCE01nite_01570 [Cellulomonas cellasea]|uniref:Uncharacterized protein n=1 Tax=Cellulomonas cellasea TaxID=43670 RepID=A0A4Y3KTK8_9CELL|nr:hypothetical protein CCE01nite_01570 [Cellulomonas cellasea]